MLFIQGMRPLGLCKEEVAIPFNVSETAHFFLTLVEEQKHFG